ncbi:MAG: hypothetical protein JWO82_2000 [Akkermansiaceae bacterium]|nr:hypothetical protein [Akkermansiaceae bacterium]
MIGADGTLTGFAGGLKAKALLLGIESKKHTPEQERSGWHLQDGSVSISALAIFGPEDE